MNTLLLVPHTFFLTNTAKGHQNQIKKSFVDKQLTSEKYHKGHSQL